MLWTRRRRAFGLRFRRQRFRLERSGPLQILLPGSNTGARASSQMTKKAMPSRFVFGVIFDRAPKQTAGPAPAVEDDAIKERLVSRSNDERVVFVRFLFPSCPPVEDECLESHLAQTSSDVVGVISADAALLRADMNQIIVNRGIARDTVFFCQLARRCVRCR